MRKQHILCLPHEVFRFSILPLLSLRDIGLLDAAIAQKTLRSELLNRLAKYKLPEHVQVTAYLVRWLVTRTIYLRSAKISQTIYDLEVSRLTAVLGFTKKVVFRDCSRITDEAVIKITKHCPQLEILIVNLCANVTDASVAAIADNCAKLHTLDIGNNLHTKNDTLVRLAQKLGPSLQKLSIAWNARLSDEALFAITQHCVNVSVLDISGDRRITDASRGTIPKRCPHLISLDMSKSDNVTDVMLFSLAQDAKQIQTLKVSGGKFTDVGLMEVGINCTALLTLDIGFCYNITDDSAEIVFENCVHLCSLKLNNCFQITDTSILKLAEKCVDLELLLLNHIENLTDESITQVATHCTKLKTLDLSHCTGITQLSVTALALNCTNLQFLSLNRIPEAVTMPAILALSEHSLKLVTLNLGSCAADTVDALGVLLARNAQRCRPAKVVYTVELSG